MIKLSFVAFFCACLIDISSSASITTKFSVNGTDYVCNAENQTYSVDDAECKIFGRHISGKNNNAVTIFNASFKNNDLQKVPIIILQIFSNLRELLLQEVNLKILDENSFSSCSNLKIVRFANDHILSISANVFEPCANIEEIEFDNNTIDLMDDRAFKGLAKLKRLTLKENSLGFLSSELFTSLESLEELTITGQQIKEIYPDTFLPLPNLKFVDLSYNKLSSLSSALFQSNANLENVILDSNSIDAVDRNILQTWPKSAFMSILNNDCIDMHFEEYFGSEMLSIEQVEEYFATCFDNFDKLLEVKGVGSVQPENDQDAGVLDDISGVALNKNNDEEMNEDGDQSNADSSTNTGAIYDSNNNFDETDKVNNDDEERQNESGTVEVDFENGKTITSDTETETGDNPEESNAQETGQDESNAQETGQDGQGEQGDEMEVVPGNESVGEKQGDEAVEENEEETSQPEDGGTSQGDENQSEGVFSVISRIFGFDEAAKTDEGEPEANENQESEGSFVDGAEGEAVDINGGGDDDEFGVEDFKNPFGEEKSDDTSTDLVDTFASLFNNNNQDNPKEGEEVEEGEKQEEEISNQENKGDQEILDEILGKIFNENSEVRTDADETETVNADGDAQNEEENTGLTSGDQNSDIQSPYENANARFYISGQEVYTCVIYGAKSTLKVITGDHIEGYSDENVEALFFRDSQFMHSIPQVIFERFPNLKTISAENSEIKIADPELLESCGKLENIDLSNNKIRRISKEAFSHCAYLEHLILTGNEIEHIDTDIFQTNPYLTVTIGSLRLVSSVVPKE